MARDDEKYYRESWMSDDQWECAQMIADISQGWHHVTGKIIEWGRGIKYSCHASRLATFDYEGLTRAVIMAHDRCIRLELAASSPGRVGLCLWKRHTRTGDRMSRHPTIHEAVAQWHDPKYPQPEEIKDAARAAQPLRRIA